MKDTCKQAIFRKDTRSRSRAEDPLRAGDQEERELEFFNKFGDNRYVITSATLSHSTLTKHHNLLAFHRVREAIAARIMAFYLIQSANNLSDMLTKHWDHPSIYSMILKLFITGGNITLIPKEAMQEKEKETT